MNQLRRMFRIHRILIKQDLKRMMEYKGDFIVGVLSMLINQVLNVVFLSIIFTKIPSLLGWNFNEVVFIYGFSLIPKGIDHLFFDNLWIIGHFTVQKGEFDKYLTRPLNSLFHVMVERLQADAFGELVVGAALICTSLPQLNIEYSVGKILLILIVIPFSSLIYTSIKIGTAAIAFWIKRSGNITFMFYMVNDFAKYPVTIYNSFVKTIVTYIIPFAFTAFYPAKYFLTGDNPGFNIGTTVILTLILMLLSIFIWNKGIKAYESAGS